MVAQSALTSASAYLANEAESELRHEFVAGSVYAMSGGSQNHVQIVTNLTVLLDGMLGDGVCQSLARDLKVRVASANSYFYPDGSISCPPRFIDAANGIIDNPTVLFEVLSPRTAIFDRGAKFAAYRTLESLRDYVLVESDSVSVEVYSLEEGEWCVRAYSGLGEVALLPSVTGRLALATLYKRVEFVA